MVEIISRNEPSFPVRSAVDQLTKLIEQISLLRETVHITEERLVRENNTISELNLKLTESNDGIVFLEGDVKQRHTM